MNLGALIKGAIALGIPRIARSNSGAPAGLVDPSTGKTIPNTLVGAAPATAQIYCSPIAGDPDTAAEAVISMFWHEVTGFLLPESGVLTEIHAIFQNNGANPATAKNVRWTVATVKQDPTAETGLAIDQVLDSGIASVAGNASGDVMLATGKSLAVPSQFVVCIKAATDNTNTLKVQNLRSGGPVPGVVGAYASGLVAAAAYSTTTTDLDVVTPAALATGEKIKVSIWKGLSVYIKWRKA